MSAKTRFAAAGDCFVPHLPRDAKGRFIRRPEHKSGVPGALGFDLAGPVEVAGWTWTTDDARPGGMPIGAHLAAEMAGASS